MVDAGFSSGNSSEFWLAIDHVWWYPEGLVLFLPVDQILEVLLAFFAVPYGILPLDIAMAPGCFIKTSRFFLVGRVLESGFGFVVKVNLVLTFITPLVAPFIRLDGRV